MARFRTIALMIGTMAALAACAQREEEVVYMEPEPIVQEPAATKY